MKILAIQNRMGIGDMVIFLPFIEAISKKFNSPVSILVKESSKALEYLEKNKYIEKILILERNNNNSHHDGIIGSLNLAKELKIINDIQKAKPTDGLWDDTRTDENQIGASYNELEWAMNELDNGKSESDFFGREKEVFNILKNFNTANKHKMVPIPICEIPENLKN